MTSTSSELAALHAGQRPDPGAAQSAGRRLGRGRARHRLPPRPGRGIPGGVDRAIDYAKALDCPKVNCLAGILPAGVAAETAARRWSTICAMPRRLKCKAGHRAADRADQHARHSRAFSSTAPARRSSSSRRSARTISTCNTTSTTCRSWRAIWRARIEANLPRIAHIQLADNPGRHEPGTGEINYPFLFGHLDEIGYAGWIGCEYKPLGQPRTRASAG